MSFLGSSVIKTVPANAGDTDSIPGSEEPGRLKFLGSQTVGHNLATEQAHT